MGENIRELVSVDESNIKRGHIYWSAIPYSDKRPLGVFVSSDGVNGSVQDETPETFKAKYNNKIKRKVSEEVDIIVRHKKRLVTVIQSDDIEGKYVYVLPITTTKDANETQFYIDNLDVPKFHYIGKTTGRDAVVNIADMKRIHKSLLLDKHGQAEISTENLEIIGKKLATLMDIEKIEKCDECIHNYKNYIEKKELEEFNKASNE